MGTPGGDARTSVMAPVSAGARFPHWADQTWKPGGLVPEVLEFDLSTRDSGVRFGCPIERAHPASVVAAPAAAGPANVRASFRALALPGAPDRPGIHSLRWRILGTGPESDLTLPRSLRGHELPDRFEDDLELLIEAQFQLIEPPREFRIRVQGLTHLHKCANDRDVEPDSPGTVEDAGELKLVVAFDLERPRIVLVTEIDVTKETP